MVIFWVSWVFSSFFMFGGYFGLFFLVSGVFWSFFGFGVILVIFRFQGYFAHFLGFGGILVIDSSRKISELDGTDFGEFESLKEINK